MAIIGQQLLQPEAGWKRYDDSFQAIKYSEVITETSSQHWNSRCTALNSKTSEMNFNFFGKALRIIGARWTNRADNVIIAIDDVYVAKINQYGAAAYMTLDFEKTFDNNGFHSVNIKFEGGSSFVFVLDAIDINSDGYLLHQDEVTDVKDLIPGKRIRCHYKATSNQVGLFSNLGQEVYKDGINDFIPATSSATPNGCFYFLCVGYDENGKIKLVADRNIQHSISWDKINEAGFMSGNNPSVSIVNIMGSRVIYPANNNPLEIRITGRDGGGISLNKRLDKKYYWEAIVSKTGVVGVATLEHPIQEGIMGFNSDIVNIPLNSGSSISYAAELTLCDFQKQRIDQPISTTNPITIGVLFDFQNKTVHYFVDGNKITSYSFVGDIVLYPRFGACYMSSNATLKLNLTEEDFKYPPQEDYIPLYTKEELELGNFIIRSLSGGISSSDKNNEWDKIIVESNLNNTIAAGDNAIWNWSGVGSWTLTSFIGSATSRVGRGGHTAKYWIDGGSSTIAANTGFRPVLMIDNAKNINFIIKNKDKFYTIKDSTIKEADKKSKNDYMNTNNLFNTIKKAEYNHLKNNDIFKNKINKKLNKKINIK